MTIKSFPQVYYDIIVTVTLVYKQDKFCLQNRGGIAVVCSLFLHFPFLRYSKSDDVLHK